MKNELVLIKPDSLLFNAMSIIRSERFYFLCKPEYFFIETDPSGGTAFSLICYK